MRILLDECVHSGVRAAFRGHAVSTVSEAGGAAVKAAPSLDLAERGFDIFLTIDRKLEHLIDLSKSALGFVMVRVASNTLEAYRPNFDRLLQAVETVRKREVIHLDTRLGR